MVKERKKVFVGLSGGVDSSVSAGLLKKEGYDVTGVFIKVWHPDFLECDWKTEMRDAMRVCAKLEIPFLKLDLEKEYKEQVIDYMLDEYKKGRTPNPDVMCNKYIKFGGFFDFAMKRGADYVATGHYARVFHDKEREGRLFKPKDNLKDQTYFLWTLTKGELKKTFFPIGNLKKDEVRHLAKKWRLFTADKKDSQGLCFIGEVEMREFLQRHLDTKKGDVLDEDGEVVGEHGGSILYTLGQRHGFRINKQSPQEKSHFVIAKDLKRNTITVSSDPSDKFKQSIQKEYAVESLNLINKDIHHPEWLEVLTRYRGEPQRAKLEPKKEKIIFEGNGVLVASGQSVVFYKGEECVGGAIIK